VQKALESGRRRFLEQDVAFDLRKVKVREGGLGQLVRNLFGMSGMTLGNTIGVDRGLAESLPPGSFERLVWHELFHVHQYRSVGRVRFLLGYLWKWIAGGFSYTDHPWEIEARDFESFRSLERERLAMRSSAEEGERPE
jgi:hypothetical protein